MRFEGTSVALCGAFISISSKAQLRRNPTHFECFFRRNWKADDSFMR
jgi:hypothetical protein